MSDVATVFVMLGLMGFSALFGLHQSVAVVRSRREYRRRLERVPAAHRRLEFAAIDDDQIQVSTRLVTVPGFPTRFEFAELSVSKRSLYRSALRDRRLLARWIRLILSPVATAVIALATSRVVALLWEALSPMVNGSWPDHVTLARLFGMVLLLEAILLGAVVADAQLRARSRQAQRLLKWYDKEVARGSGGAANE